MNLALSRAASEMEVAQIKSSRDALDTRDATGPIALDRSDRTYRLPTNKVAPATAFTTAAGEPWTFEEHKGKVVLIEGPLLCSVRGIVPST